MSARCWAAELRKCEGKITREHYISKGIFLGTEQVTLTGFPFSPDVPKVLPLKSAVSNILCEVHNRSLSPYDFEAKRFSRYLAAMFSGAPTATESMELNGGNFERWALKTVINLGAMRSLHREQANAILPKRAYLDYLFEGANLARGMGLYFLPTPGSTTRLVPGLNFRVFRDKDKSKAGQNVVSAVEIEFSGLRFILSLQPGEPTILANLFMATAGTDFFGINIAYHPTLIRCRAESLGERCISIIW